jgi:hypothetical protein
LLSKRSTPDKSRIIGSSQYTFSRRIPISLDLVFSPIALMVPDSQEYSARALENPQKYQPRENLTAVLGMPLAVTF